MKTTEDLGQCIVKGVLNPGAKDLIVELSELGMDAFLEEGILKEIPVLGSLIACKKTWDSVRDRLFLRKVTLFFAATPGLTEAEKDTFVREYLADEKKARGLFDALVLLIDKLDDFEKAEMLAKAFAALARGKISVETFRRLASAIDIGFVVDLKGLANDPRQAKGATDAYLPHLYRAGLSKLEILYSGASFPMSDLGKIFVECMNAP